MHPILRVLRAAAAVVLFVLFADVSPTWAHPPYEYLERVIVDERGRQLQVFRSYIDGIVFTDPVKLVIRDGGGAAGGGTVSAVATGFGRNVAILCWRQSACVVFRYDEFWSMKPDKVWRLERGALVATNSWQLAALGIVAPLWTDASGYVVMLVTIGIPALILWLLSEPRSRIGQAIQALAIIFTSFCALAWVYAVAMLSYLLLHLVALALLTAFAGVAPLYRIARKSSLWPARFTAPSSARL